MTWQVAGQVVMLEEKEKERIEHEDGRYFTHCGGNMTHVQGTVYRVYKRQNTV